MIAIKRLQSIMWILVIAVGALTAYLVSLRVATERNAVTSLDRQIYATRANIRYLEVEFSARSNLRQLAAWNAQDIKYSVPGQDQYLTSEHELASLGSVQPGAAPYVAPPVMAAMAQAQPAVVKAPEPQRSEDAPALALARAAAATAPAAPKAVQAVAIAKPAAPRVVNLVDKPKPAPADGRAMRLAQLEATLLDMRAPPSGASKAAR